uniref:Uncharacterized protein n=1 Tax=Arundo donax TaxID=35708 RepID=A0A0A8Y1X1_ARUDO
MTTLALQHHLQAALRQHSLSSSPVANPCIMCHKTILPIAQLQTSRKANDIITTGITGSTHLYQDSTVHTFYCGLHSAPTAA